MNRTKFLVAVSAAALALVSAGPAWADATPECNNGTGLRTTECGTNSTTGTYDASTAIGAQANVAGNASTGVGSSVLTFEDRTTAVGTQARATITGGTSLGNGASAISDLYPFFVFTEPAAGTLGGTAIGTLSLTYGFDSVAVGAYAAVGDWHGSSSQPFLNGSTAIGASSVILSNEAVSLGAHTNVTADQAIAIGYGASATHTNSIAIGAGTATTAADQVNVGGRTISGVTNGTLSAASTDVVTGQQLFATNTTVATHTTQIATLNTTVGTLSTTVGTHTTQIAELQAADTALDSRVDALEAIALDFDEDIRRFDDRASAGTATAIALSGGMFLPNKGFNLTGNVGAYRGAVAGALQVGAMVGDNIAVNAGVSRGFNKGGKTGVRAGFTIGW